MKRAALAAGMAIALAGCGAVPAAVLWPAITAGLGFGTAALTFDDHIFTYWAAQRAAPALPPAGEAP